MLLRNTSILRPMLAVLAITMLAVGLACTSEEEPTAAPTAVSTPTTSAAATPFGVGQPTATPVEPTAAPTAVSTPTTSAAATPFGVGQPTATPVEPTMAPTAVSTPTTPAAATPLIVDGQATATPVVGPDTDLTWTERFLRSPGYDPEWGQPVKGGTYIFGAQGESTIFHPISQSCCYTHGCYAGLPTNSLFRIDPWVGDFTQIEGDLAESWEMSEDGVTLTIQLRQGVMFHDNPTIPSEFNGGQINGDEFVCEDAKATYERFTNPPEWETRISVGKADLNHLESLSCPDGPRAHTLVMHFERPMGKTMGILAGRAAVILDKDFIAWLNDFGAREGRSFLDNEVPDNFYSMHGTGPFMPTDINVGVSATYHANPTYWKEGLPLLDRYHNVVIKDIGSRFTALVTGKIHYMGEGFWSMTPGQAELAIRDFSDRIVINNQLNHWARTLAFGANAPWDDVRVRKAIHLAIDRDQWLEFYRIAGFEGMKLAHTMAPGTYYAPTDEEIRTWPGYRQPKDEDVAEANRLMDEVFGAGERPTAECTARIENQSDIYACLFVIDNLKKNLGMEIGSNFGVTEAISPITESGNFDFCISSYTSTVIGDPDDDLYSNYLPDFVSVTSRNIVDARWEEQPEVMQEVADMIMAQSAELDPVKRKEMVTELDLKILNEVSEYLLVGWSLIFPGWRVELKGWKGYDLYSYSKYVQNERMWLADN